MGRELQNCIIMGNCPYRKGKIVWNKLIGVHYIEGVFNQYENKTFAGF